MTESAMRAAVDWLCPTFGSGPHVAGGGQAAHQCFPCCLRNPPIPEKKAAAGWLCAAVLPKEGAQYYEYASYSCTRTAVESQAHHIRSPKLSKSNPVAHSP
eukprot:SAG25_NODE_186_length_12406_cov_7.083530_9_plen_101_part_00